LANPKSVSSIAYRVSREEKELEEKEDRKTKVINIFFSLSCYTTKVYTNKEIVSSISYRVSSKEIEEKK